MKSLYYDDNIFVQVPFDEDLVIQFRVGLLSLFLNFVIIIHQSIKNSSTFSSIKRLIAIGLVCLVCCFVALLDMMKDVVFVVMGLYY